jgi:hypothetical protein
MKSLKFRICLRAAVSLAVFVLAWQASAYALEPAQIFSWVAQQMDMAEPGRVPAVLFVDKAGLQDAFSKANPNTFERWQASYGTHQAQEFWNLYLQDLVGMFDPETTTIYIGRFLTPCRQEAILAHEITHYFQQLRNGRIETGTQDAQNVQLRREMQASHIEQLYSELFCIDKKPPLGTVATP